LPFLAGRTIFGSASWSSRSLTILNGRGAGNRALYSGVHGSPLGYKLTSAPFDRNERIRFLFPSFAA
jgi:hypothetical protein